MSREKRTDPGGDRRGNQRVTGSGRPAREGAVVESDKKQAKARQTDGRDAQKPSEIPSAGWKAIATRVQREIKDDNLSLLAAGVAFKALLALFPALIAVVSIWGLVADEETVTQQITDLTAELPEGAAGLIEDQLTGITTGDGLGIALLISLATALWAASGGMQGLMQGCSAAYNETDERSFPVKRGVALLLTLGGIIFLLIAIGLIAVLPVVLGQIGLGGPAELAIRIGQWPLLALVAIVSISLVYKIGPDRASPQGKWVTWGAVIGTVLWLIGSALFTLYIENFGNYQETYGAIAGVIILMLWLLLTAFSILVGAEINAEMERQTRVDTTTGDPLPMGEREATVADHTPEEYEQEHH